MISALLSPLLRYICGGLLFLNVITGIAWQIEKRGHAKANQRIVELTELRKADRASYEAAQKQAEALNQAKVRQIEKQQDSINEKARSDYRRDLDRLRAQSRTDQGAPGGSKAPGVPKAAPGTDADGVPAAPCDNLCASEIELRLMYLQNWLAEQLKVER